MATIPDWARLIGQQLDDEAWRSRADVWHDEVQTQTNTNTTDIATHESEITVLQAKFTATTSYTPTLTQSNTVTKTVDFADYHVVDGWLTFEVHMTATGTGTGANAVVSSIPITPFRTQNRPIATGWFVDASTGILYNLLGYRSDTTSITFVRTANESTSPYLGLGGFTAAIASGDVLSFWGGYRVT